MKISQNMPKYTFGWKGALLLLVPFIVFGIIIQEVDVQSLLPGLSLGSIFAIFSILIWIISIYLFDFYSCRPETGKPLNFNISARHLSSNLLIFPMMFGMMILADFITNSIPTTGPFFGELYKNFQNQMKLLSSDVPSMIFMTIFVAPIFEEIVFRGIIMKGIINKGISAGYAIWISSLVFGIVHGNPWQFLGAIVLGMVLGYVYEKTQSLFYPILLHAFNNGLSVWVLYSSHEENLSNFLKISKWNLLWMGMLIFFVSFFLYHKKKGVAELKTPNNRSLQP